jgi:hypothetical protein
MEILSLFQKLGPEWLTGGLFAGVAIFALVLQLKRMRQDDSRNDAEVQFRGDLFKQIAEQRAEIKELKERADRFADERNKALLAAAAMEASNKELAAQVGGLQALHDIRRGDK